MIDGAKELDKLLSGLPKALEVKILRSVHREAAKVIQEEMKAKAPVGNDSIYNNIKVGHNKADDDKTNITVGVTSKGFVARFVEYGTQVRTTKKGWNRGDMQPRPFIQPAINSKMDTVMNNLTENYAETINKYLEREVKKISKKNNSK